MLFVISCVMTRPELYYVRRGGIHCSGWFPSWYRMRLFVLRKFLYLVVLWDIHLFQVNCCCCGLLSRSDIKIGFAGVSTSFSLSHLCRRAPNVLWQSIMPHDKKYLYMRLFRSVSMREWPFWPLVANAHMSAILQQVFLFCISGNIAFPLFLQSHSDALLKRLTVGSLKMLN